MVDGGGLYDKSGQGSGETLGWNPARPGRESPFFRTVRNFFSEGRVIGENGREKPVMNKLKALPGSLVLGLLLAGTVFTAGFFHAGAEPNALSRDMEPGRPAAGMVSCEEACIAEKFPMDAPSLSPSRMRPGIYAPSGSYEQRADVSVEVENVVETIDRVREQIEGLGGQIVSMDTHGNDDGRQGSIQVELPAESFNVMLSHCRGWGTVLQERITIRRISLQSDERSSYSPGGTDLREFALVEIRMHDRKIAPEVMKSSGLLAASFGRSTGHFLKGLAVVVEVLGYVLPYLVAVFLLVAIMMVGARGRRCFFRTATAK